MGNIDRIGINHRPSGPSPILAIEIASSRPATSPSCRRSRTPESLLEQNTQNARWLS